MPPPSSFVDITTIPFSRVVTKVEFDVANEFWFRFITATDVAFSQVAFTNIEFCNIYASDGTTRLVRFIVRDWFWWKLTAGTYYIKLDMFPVGVVPGDFTYQADTRPLNSTFEEGSVLIPDDSGDNYGGVIVESDGNIPTIATAVPASEIGAALSNGYVLIHDRYGKHGTSNALVLLNPDLTFNQKIIPTTPFTGFPRISHSNTDFYAVNQSTGQLWKVTTAGVCTLVTTIAEIAADGVGPFGVNSDGTIAYFSIPDDGIIRKYIIATDTSSVLYTIPGFAPEDIVANTYDSNPGEIIVLPDGSLVTWWNDFSTSNCALIHLSSAGVLLHTIPFISPETIDHLSYANTTLSTHVKAWIFLEFDASRSKLGNLNLSTGVFDTSATFDNFFSNQNAGKNNNSFGPASSCPMFTLFPAGGGGEPDPTDGGLYYINPTKAQRHDSYYPDVEKKIPNPTIETALLGE